MDAVKLVDSEIKVMCVIWDEGDIPAKSVAQKLTERYRWSKNTTYTLIKRCIRKGALERREPGFICHSLISRKIVQKVETDELIDRVYGGSADKLFAALLGNSELTAEDIRRLRQMAQEMKS